MTVCVALALRNRPDGLGNAFLSLAQQAIEPGVPGRDFALCVLDDASEPAEDPLPLLRAWFPHKQVAFRRLARPAADAEGRARALAALLPEDAEIVIHAEAETIWYEPTLFERLVATVVAQRCLAVPSILDLRVDADAWRAGPDFNQVVLDLARDPARRVEAPATGTFPLVAMRRGDFPAGLAGLAGLPGLPVCRLEETAIRPWRAAGVDP